MGDAPGTGRCIRVSSIDDHEVIHAGLAAVLHDVADIELVAATPTVSAFLGDLPDGVDVVLLDLSLADGVAVAVNVRALLDRGLPVLVYTSTPLDPRARAALREGALGVVDKTRVDDLVAAVRGAAVGQPFLSTDLAQLIASDREPSPALSARERETVRYVAEGPPMKSVARRMNVSEGTAKDFLKRAREKYVQQGRPAPTQVHILRRAVEDGLLGLPAARGDDVAR